MMKKPKVIAILGKSGSGKDTLLSALLDTYDLNKIIIHTSRPRRSHERNCVDYEFLCEEEIIDNSSEGQYCSEQCFNSWYYCIPKDGFKEDKINVIIVNPSSLDHLIKSNLYEIYVVELIVSDIERLQRSMRRGDEAKEVIRRIEADEKDFENLNYGDQVKWHLHLPNEEKTDEDFIQRFLGIELQLPRIIWA